MSNESASPQYIARELEQEFDRLNAEVARLQEQNSALQARVDEGGWRSMESAPKDGSRCLLGAPGEESWVDEWMADEQLWMMCDQWADPVVPTRWQPIPK